MTDLGSTEPHKRTFKQRSDQNREETERAFAEIRDAEHKARLEKTIRLRNMRLISTASNGPIKIS